MFFPKGYFGICSFPDSVGVYAERKQSPAERDAVRLGQRREKDAEIVPRDFLPETRTITRRNVHTRFHFPRQNDRS